VRPAPHPSGLHRTGWLRRDNFAFWTKLRADDRFLYGKSGKHRLRCKQHPELVGGGSDERCHHAGNIHVRIAQRFNEHEPDHDDHLHADGDERRWVNHVNVNHYRDYGQQTQANDQLVHGQPHKHHFGFQQHAELGDDRGCQSCHHPGNIHFHLREWVNERQPNGNDHLHADCDQRHWLVHSHGKSHGNCVRWTIGDHNHVVPKRNTRRCVCGLHDSRQWRLSALHLFRHHEFQLSSIT
jgi:hypothetical protein